MIIGDSLHSDIQGGQQAKFKLFGSIRPPLDNTNNSTNYTIQQLDELLPILGH